VAGNQADSSAPAALLDGSGINDIMIAG